MAHRFQHHSLSGLQICEDCGACQSRNGRFWLWGKWASGEPPCVGDDDARWLWYVGANFDPRNPISRDEQERLARFVTKRECGDGQIQTLTYHSHQPPAHPE